MSPLHPSDLAKAILGTGEPLSSNARVESSHSEKCYGWHHECAVALIERLTAERDEFEANLTIAERQVTEAMAERDRLVHDIERHIAIASEHATENERLRAALRNIRNGRVGDQIIMDVSEYAKAKLRGAADETSAAHGPGPQDVRTLCDAMYSPLAHAYAECKVCGWEIKYHKIAPL